MPPSRNLPPSANTATTLPPTSSSRRPQPPIRRNLFQSSLISRRPNTGSSTSTSAETLRLDHVTGGNNANGHRAHSRRDFNEDEEDDEERGEDRGGVVGTSDIVMRDRNGEFVVGEAGVGIGFGGGDEDDDEEEEGDGGRGDDEEKERQRLAEAVKLHCRNRNRAPSEPVELLEAVRVSLRAKMVKMAEDDWMYESTS